LKKSGKKAVANFAQGFNPSHGSKSQTGGTLRYRKNSSIDSQSKLAPGTACERERNFSLDLENNKENYPSNSSLLGGGAKSKPLSEQSKSASAGRSRPCTKKLQNDISLSSLSRSSRNLKVEASGGSLSKMLEKSYFVNGEHMLKVLSPQPGANRHSQTRKNRADLGDNKQFSASRNSSPQKP
jgi:hypothetical protein